MTDEELKAKMNELGHLMHDWEIAQEGLEASHFNMLKRLGELRDELKEYFPEGKEIHDKRYPCCSVQEGCSEMGYVMVGRICHRPSGDQ